MTSDVLIDIDNLPDALIVDYDPRPLYEWSCDDVLVPNTRIRDGRYRNDLLWDNDDRSPKPVCLPHNVKKIIIREKKRHRYSYLSEPFRRILLLGLADHNYVIGDELHVLNSKPSIMNAIEENDGKIMDKLAIPVITSFESKRCTTVRLNKDFYEMIDEAREDAGVWDKEKFVAYLIVRGLRKHTAYSKWYQKFDSIISEMDRQLKARADTLEKI